MPLAILVRDHYKGWFGAGSNHTSVLHNNSLRLKYGYSFPIVDFPENARPGDEFSFSLAFNAHGIAVAHNLVRTGRNNPLKAFMDPSSKITDGNKLSLHILFKGTVDKIDNIQATILSEDMTMRTPFKHGILVVPLENLPPTISMYSNVLFTIFVSEANKPIAENIVLRVE